jgi:hypothetical protein
VLGALLGATQPRNETAYVIGKWVGYLLVAAAAFAIFRAIRSGRFKAGLQRVAISNKNAADAQAAAVSGASADVGGIHLHVGHNVAGTSIGRANHDDGAGSYDDDDGSANHYYLPPGTDIGATVRRLAELPASDGARCLAVADGAADGVVHPGAAVGGGADPAPARLSPAGGSDGER